MQLLAEENIPDELSPIPTTEASTSTSTASTARTSRPPEIDVRAWKAGVIAAINVLTRVLAVRAILLVAIAGAIGLTWVCLVQPDPYRLVALAIYCGSAVVPMIITALRR